MKFKVNSLLLLLVGGVYLILFGLLIYYNKVKIQVGNNIQPVTISNINIQNITGILLIGPGKPIFQEYENQLKLVNKSLDMWMYNITYKEIIDNLKFISSKFDLNIILENNVFKQSGEEYSKLINQLSGNKTQITNDRKMGTNYVHAKTLLIDDSKFIIQSANLTYSSFYKNREFFFISENKEIVDNLNYIFEKDWKGEKIQKTDIHPNLLICNIDCRDKIENLISGAEHSIWIQTPTLDDKRIINLLNSKLKLDMRIILSDDEKEDNDLINLKPQFQKSPYLHGKSMLIDGKILMIGSINYTQNSMDNNREIAILTINPEIINQYKKSFEKDWK